MKSADIDARFAPLVGRPAWGVALGEGSFVTLEFGDAVAGAGGKTHGQWHLWVYCCAWRLDENGRIVAGSEDAREHLATAVRQLEGRRLEAVQVRPTFEAVLQFEGGWSLALFPVFSEDCEHWMLFGDDGQVLTAGPGSVATLEPA